MFKFESDSENQILEELKLTHFPDFHEDMWAAIRYEIALVALCEDWLKENVPADHYIFQIYIWWNEHFVSQRISYRYKLVLAT